MRRVLVVVIAAVVGLIGGAALALDQDPATVALVPSVVPSIEPLVPETAPANLKIIEKDQRKALDNPVVLAWTPGGLDAGFISRVRAKVPDMVVVKSGLSWMTDSFDEDGSKVDHVENPYAIPLETAVIDPTAYREFVLPADRWMLEELGQRDRDRVPGALLGSASSAIRRIGPGGELDLQGTRVKVIGVLPDEFIGAHEVVVGPDTGKRLGINRDRYLLLNPGQLSRANLTRRVEGSANEPVQMRWPGETPFLRHGDAVQPQVVLKERFGEFIARPTSGGGLDIGPGFGGQLETRRVPLLGKITCNKQLMPQLVGAMKELQRASLGHLIHTNDGCLSARFLNRDPEAGISHHTWGVAFDINASENPFGAPPVIDHRVVRVMEDWGFTWGGRWIVPDGMHFEWISPPRD